MTAAVLQQQAAALAAAEEILQLIYGDDLAGCHVLPQPVAEVVLRHVQEGSALQQEMLEVCEKGIEALHILSTPPTSEVTPTPEQLRTILGDRLDTIQELTRKLLDTFAALRAEPAPESPIP